MLFAWARPFATLQSCLVDFEHKLGQLDPNEEVPHQGGEHVVTQLYIRAELKTAREPCQILNLEVSLRQISRLLAVLYPAHLGNFRVLAGDLKAKLNALRETVDDELRSRLFLFVPNDRAGWFHQDDKPLLGEAVDIAFPDTTKEIAEFGRCFALGQWTASVFHLMRATEIALHKWCKDLGAPLKIPAEQANWQDILNSASAQLKRIEQQPKSDQRDKDLEYFGSALVAFSGIKDAWRNHVSHSKRSYDERAATSIMQQVRAFMERLASRS